MGSEGRRNNSLLCPNCRKLISRSVVQCPYCGLKKPGSLLKDNFLTRGKGGGEQIIRLILVCNIVMYVVSLLIDFSSSAFSGHPLHFLSPSNNSLLVLGSTGSIPLFHLQRWWSLISASYLHGSLVHIIFNMIALHQLGPLVIREFGGRRLIIIYSLSGVGGYILSSLVGVRLTIGASAAVCGLIGAMLYYGKFRGGTYGNAVFSQLGGWAVGIALFGFMVPGINNWGHGGGMAAGFLLAAILGYKEKKTGKYIDTVLAGCCIAITGLVLIWSCFNGLVFLLG